MQTREARGSEDGSGGRRRRISRRMSSLSGRDTGVGPGKDDEPALVWTADAAAARSDPMKHLQGCMARIA